MQDISKTANYALGVMSSPEVIAENTRINKALTKAVERVKLMTPEKLEAMKKAQRESWTRQNHD